MAQPVNQNAWSLFSKSPLPYLFLVNWFFCCVYVFVIFCFFFFIFVSLCFNIINLIYLNWLLISHLPLTVLFCVCFLLFRIRSFNLCVPPCMYCFPVYRPVIN